VLGKMIGHKMEAANSWGVNERCCFAVPGASGPEKHDLARRAPDQSRCEQEVCLPECPEKLCSGQFKYPVLTKARL
ncbi:hypothetical protein, partial [Roseibium sp. RKSG952]|uniref:hypothetical protein n=1 Tax=Roseibium sp. RKSG952 TaxID=2529384 RepID=UPI001AD8B0D5